MAAHIVVASFAAFDWSFAPDTFPSVWFGANASGPEQPWQHAGEARYRAIYFGCSSQMAPQAVITRRLLCVPRSLR